MKRLAGIRISPALLASILRPGTKVALVLTSITQDQGVLANRTVICSCPESILMDNGSFIQLKPFDVIELYDDGFVLRAPNGVETTYLWDHVYA
jgi:hypothetical protein